MKAYYEAPNAEIIDFHAMKSLAVVNDEEIKDSELGVASREE